MAGGSKHCSHRIARVAQRPIVSIAVAPVAVAVTYAHAPKPQLRVDGTKVKADASRSKNLDFERILREIMEEAIATDPGGGQGLCRDELPASAGRRPARC